MIQSITSQIKKGRGNDKRKSNSRNRITGFLIFQLVLIAHFANAQDIVGNYYSIEPKCKLALKIYSTNQFSFDLGAGKKLRGKVKISKADNTTYLDFNEISSMFEKDTIYIQNSGNSMNPYVHFEKCNEKYIRLVKRH